MAMLKSDGLFIYLIFLFLIEKLILLIFLLIIIYFTKLMFVCFVDINMNEFYNFSYDYFFIFKKLFLFEIIIF